MSEIIDVHQQPEAPIPIVPDEEARKKAAAFLADEIPALCRLTGLDVKVSIGEGWVTDLDTGDFTIDPNFFLERGYNADHTVYASMHELLAHVRDVKRDPVFAARQRSFDRKGTAEAIFGNIMTDIHGNHLMHKLLPHQAAVAADLYDTKLFPLESDGQAVDYTAKPLHLQLLYKMLRQEMVPDVDMPVSPEVDQALEGLRNYKGSGVDMVKYLTNPGLKMSGSDRFDRQLAIIYPVYKKLLEQSGVEGDGFDADYADYFSNLHPEPMDEAQKVRLDGMIRKGIRDQVRAEKDDKAKAKQERQAPLDRMLKEQTGFGLAEHQAYTNEVGKYRDAINGMRDVYQSAIKKRVATRRGLSRTAYADGDILNPNRLAQTVTDIKSGVRQPEAFTRYEEVKGHAELSGKLDYIFLFDCSSSMYTNERHEAAAASALIMLEALAGMRRDIQEAAEQHGDLGLDIRSGLYIFGDDAQCLKPLGTSINDTERLTVRNAILNPSGNETTDFLALEAVDQIPRATDRQRVVITICDGTSSDPERASATIDALRKSGDIVYGVGIQAEEVRQLYGANSVSVDNPNDLPKALQPLVEKAFL